MRVDISQASGAVGRPNSTPPETLIIADILLDTTWVTAANPHGCPMERRGHAKCQHLSRYGTTKVIIILHIASSIKFMSFNPIMICFITCS